jgi:hypothetical protein
MNTSDETYHGKWIFKFEKCLLVENSDSKRRCTYLGFLGSAAANRIASVANAKFSLLKLLIYEPYLP